MQYKMKIKLSELNLVLGILGAIFLGIFLVKQPLFLGYFAIMCIPGFLLTYLFSKSELSFLERLALSLPLANIFLIILRAFSLIGLPFGKELAFLVVVLLPLAIGLLNYRFFHRKIGAMIITRKLELSKLFATIFVVALAVFLCWLMWGSLLQDTKLPLTDQVVQFSWTQYYKSSVEKFHKYPYWVSEYSGGFPISIFEASFYYERTALDWLFFPGHNLVSHMNAYSFLNLALLLIGIFCLTRRFGWGRVAAIAGMALFISSPLLGSKLGYSGDMKEMTSFAILPIMIVVFFLMLEKKQPKYYILFGMLAASYYFTNLVPLIPSLIMLAFMFLLYKIFNKELLIKEEAVGIIALAAVVVMLIGFNLVPLFLSLRFGTPETWTVNLDPVTFIRDIIKPMFSNPAMQYTHNLGLLFGIAAIAGMALSLLRFRRKENYLLLAFWAVLLCYIVPVLKIPLLHVETHRLVLLTLMVFSLFIAGIFENLKKVEYKAGAVVLLIILLAGQLPLARSQSSAWVNEQAQNGMFEQIYRELDKLGPGRAINYGIFAYGTEPLMPVESDSIWMITHTTGSGTRTIPQYELKDGSESALNKEHSISYIINRMRTTFTRYIIVVKDPAREGDITYARLRDYLTNSSILFDNDQLAIFSVPDAFYIQSAEPVETNLTKEEIYSAPDGWKVFMPTELAGQSSWLNSTEDIKEQDYPIVYDYKILSPGEFEIYGNFSGERIVVKDHYFPTWHAYMDGRELDVVENNLGTLMIKTETGDKIHLIIQPYWYEPLLAGAAAIFIIAIFFLLSFMERRERGRK